MTLPAPPRQTVAGTPSAVDACPVANRTTGGAGVFVWHNPGPNARRCTECDKHFFAATVCAEGCASDYRPQVHCPHCEQVQRKEAIKEGVDNTCFVVL